MKAPAYQQDYMQRLLPGGQNRQNTRNKPTALRTSVEFHHNFILTFPNLDLFWHFHCNCWDDLTIRSYHLYPMDTYGRRRRIPGAGHEEVWRQPQGFHFLQSSEAHCHPAGGRHHGYLFPAWWVVPHQADVCLQFFGNKISEANEMLVIYIICVWINTYIDTIFSGMNIHKSQLF